MHGERASPTNADPEDAPEQGIAARVIQVKHPHGAHGHRHALRSTYRSK
jgi:hypothetical protein